ncbi:MAG TPA: glutathione binding-like protein [Steroidobacteraceae bacterium]|nr:glutathione binding-like protein [Steroidobacteraceae bacterium]HQZ80795.1 glutathione binding-like protein [Steroidobacteraceae bacterium]
MAGAARSLMPTHGADRRRALQVIALAVGAADKGREQIYESAFRPPEKRHEPWVERCRSQMHGAVAALDAACAARGEGAWLVGERPTQADITAVVVTTFLVESPAVALDATAYPALHAFVARCEARAEFRATHVPPSAPQAWVRAR